MVHWCRFCLMTSTAYSLIWNSMYGVSRWKIDMCVPECHGVNSLEVMHFQVNNSPCSWSNKDLEAAGIIHKATFFKFRAFFKGKFVHTSWQNLCKLSFSSNFFKKTLSQLGSGIELEHFILDQLTAAWHLFTNKNINRMTNGWHGN